MSRSSATEAVEARSHSFHSPVSDGVDRDTIDSGGTTVGGHVDPCLPQDVALAQVGQGRQGLTLPRPWGSPPARPRAGTIVPTDPVADHGTMMITTTTISKAAQGTSAVTTIHADELLPGDVFMDDGHNHQITRIDRHDGWAWPIAGDDTGWAIALGHQLIDVHRRAA